MDVFVFNQSETEVVRFVDSDPADLKSLSKVYKFADVMNAHARFFTTDSFFI
jgi:hypothetical protein